MATILTTLGSLLLVIALLPATHANWVTWRQCKTEEHWGIVDKGTEYPNATTLYLTHCQIEKLVVGDFEGLPNLDALYLDGNDISHIDPAMFSSVPNLTALGLSDNKLVEVPAFNDYSLFTHMQAINFNHNRISAISNPHIFSSFQKLLVLDLSDNLIEYIHPDTFKPLKKLRDLDLSNNKISVITDTMFQIESLKWLDLSNNSIEYVSENAFHGSSLKELFIYDNRFAHLPSDFITNFKGSGANLERFLFYGKSWHCSCMLELFSEINRLGSIDFRVHRYSGFSGSQSACVYIGRYPCDRYAPLALMPFFTFARPPVIDDSNAN